MEIFGISVDHYLKPNLRILIMPILMAALLVFLGVFIIKNGMERITSKIEELDKLDQVVLTLQEKVNVLREIEGIILNQADTSVVALPGKNPSLVMLGQIERLASEKSVEITNKGIQSQAGASEGLESAKLNLSLSGGLYDVLDFLMRLDQIAPISTIDQIDLSKKDETQLSSFVLSVYWGNFPTRIPPITEPIKTLTAKEQDLVNQLARLSKPEFVNLLPEAPVNRENPFR